MKTMPFVLFIVAALAITSCAGSRSTKNNYLLKETSRQSTGQKMKKVLIVGNGSTGTRFFLENLSAVLKQKLQLNQVETSFTFLGFKEDIDKKFSGTLNHESYDAVLRFEPTSDALNPIVVDDYNIAASNASVQIQTVSVRFTQDFVVSFISKEGKKSLWTASLNTNLDSTKDKFYIRIADDLIKYLQQDFL